MKSKTTLVSFGGPRRIVQELRSRTQTIAVCPLCRARFRPGDETILVDLVKSIRLTPAHRRDLEFTVRIHVCGRCAEPIVQRKREAMSKLISLLAKLIVEDVLREAGQEARAEPNAKKPRTPQRKRRNPQR
jgi:hypothetical protein